MRHDDAVFIGIHVIARTELRNVLLQALGLALQVGSVNGSLHVRKLRDGELEACSGERHVRHDEAVFIVIHVIARTECDAGKSHGYVALSFAALFTA